MQNFLQLAKKNRKPGENWQECLKRTKAQLDKVKKTQNGGG
tara:strand:- start:1437 stop:1559 length:123 start_codon:yes stop_codon:yes gene_type:complete